MISRKEIRSDNHEGDEMTLTSAAGWLIYRRVLHAAHSLPAYKGKCRNLHGHTYRLEVCARPGPGSNLTNLQNDCPTMIMDFATFRALINRCVDDLDHTLLNEIIPEPTAEAIAEYIWHEITKLQFQIRYLRLMETDECGVLLERGNTSWVADA